MKENSITFKKTLKGIEISGWKVEWTLHKNLLEVIKTFIDWLNKPTI